LNSVTRYSFAMAALACSALLPTAKPVNRPSKQNLLKKVLHSLFLSSLLFALFLHPRTANAQTGTFTATGSMTTPRYQYAAALLANGQVLIAGGWSDPAISVYLASAELYDPATGTFSATGSMTTVRVDPTATLLPNGQVLVAGGNNCTGCVLASAELYDPATGVFTATGSMTTPRYNHTATLLLNGQVLVAGGCPNPGPCEPVASAELYNPSTGIFSATSSMTTARSLPYATLLPNGRVLIAGGTNGLSTALTSAELYSPATGTFSTTGSLITARSSQGTAELLLTGKVLFPGGCGSSGALASAELYNPATGAFSATGSLTTPRCYHTAALLLNGEVLVAGGGNNSGELASAEIYNPAAGTFSATGSMTTAVAFVRPAATLLPNGEVLVAGGDSGSGPVANAGLYMTDSRVWRAAFGLFWQFR